MLQTSQSIALSGTSRINGQQVAIFSANISLDNISPNIAISIIDEDLYKENKVEVRKDRDDFQDEADKIADGLDQQPATTVASTE